MGLNEAQQAAVSHSEGQLLVRAGPGSGKTRVIIEKVDQLMTGGVAPESILCMTFTKKADDEMRRRLPTEPNLLPFRRSQFDGVRTKKLKQAE